MRKIFIIGLVALTSSMCVLPSVSASATEKTVVNTQNDGVMPIEEWKAKKSELEGLSGITYDNLVYDIVRTFNYAGGLVEPVKKIIQDGVQARLQSLKDETIFLEWVALTTQVYVYKYNVSSDDFAVYTIHLQNAGNANITINQLYNMERNFTKQYVSERLVSLYSLGIIGGRTPDGLLVAQPSTETFTAHFEINPKLSMELGENAVTIDPSKISSFAIKPNITTNIPYKITVNNDGNVKDSSDNIVQSDVTMSFTDSKASSISGNVLNYTKAVKDTIISAEIGGLQDIQYGLLHTDVDVVLSPQ